jgi:hypothetical protein
VGTVREENASKQESSASVLIQSEQIMLLTAWTHKSIMPAQPPGAARKSRHADIDVIGQDRNLPA